MAILGKLIIVLGAGIVGTAVANEGRSSSTSSLMDLLSGTLKFVTKHLKQDNSSRSSSSDAKAAALMAQVDAVRLELKRLVSSGSVTIVTSSTGSRSYSVTAVILVGFVGGYGVIWWKGWKLSDMMFVTRRGFSDACTAVGKQLEVVSSAISHAKQHLSSRIEHVDSNLDECMELTATTKEDVSKIHGDLGEFHVCVRSVNLNFQNLVSRFSEIEYVQDLTNRGILNLAQLASLQESKNVELIQEQTGSLPPLPPEPSSPFTSVRNPMVLRSSTSVSSSGLKELQGISGPVPAAILRARSLRTGPSGTLNLTPATAGESSSNSTASRFGWKLPSLGFLARSNSTGNS